MPVYVITGASRGIGFEFLRQTSADSDNLVIGLVRDRFNTEQRVATELGQRSNIHILHADLSDYASLKQAATDSAAIVGARGVDYLVANGALVSQWDAYEPISKLADQVEEFERVSTEAFQVNVVGNVHLLNLFVPLVLKGKVKKVIALTSGHADLDLINDYELDMSTIYAATKAALNVIVAKFHAQYKKDGVLFLSLSPGVVETGHFDRQLSPEQIQSLEGFMGKMLRYAPHFKGPVSVDEAVKANIATIEKASIEGGYGGAFISHLGTKQWV
ncbi:putative short chain dehydrogenase [Phaeosphaeria sp. MPI-PUGE-AT-0046c]|nr:putative short chain dehydrogenase [Phaeosphaeria sp. MPI-PUGE-AT-0046c]